MPFTEAHFENAILEIFRDLLSYEYLYGPEVVTSPSHSVRRFSKMHSSA